MDQNKSNSCFNCQHPLNNNENYCPNCGQKNTDLNISVLELIKDFAGDYFTFDSKFFKTFGPLISKPGRVPKEYIDGKRVKHIPPLRIFIFLSFITFFLWGLNFDRKETEMGSDNTEQVKNSSILTSQELIDSLNKEIPININVRNDSTVDDSKLSGALSYMMNKEIEPQEIVDSLAKDNGAFSRKVFLQGLKVYQAEEGVVYKYLMGNLSIVLLILQPFFALLLKLFYYRRKSFFYIEHLVFSLYYHSFILIATIVLFFLSFYIGVESVVLTLFLLSFIYFLLAAKRFYEQKWGKTVLKSTLITFIYQATMFPLFILGYLFLSLYFY